LSCYALRNLVRRVCLCVARRQVRLHVIVLGRAKRIAFIRVWTTEEKLVTGKILDRFPTGVSLRHRAKSPADARRIMDAYRRAADRRPR